MSDTQHTPVPWKVKAPQMPVGRDKAGDRLIFSEETREHVAEVFQYRNDNHNDEATSLANAEFICKACNSHAELVAACEGLLAFIEPRLSKEGGIVGCTPNQPCVACAARAAIAKAEEGGGC